MGKQQQIATTRTGLILGAQFDEMYHNLIEGLKSKHGMSTVATFEVESKTLLLLPRTLADFDLLIRKYDIVIVLSGHRLEVNDFVRRLLALLVRAPLRKVCRPGGEDIELSWGLWMRSLLKYSLVFSKVRSAKFLGYVVAIFCFFVLRPNPGSRRT